MRRPRSLYIIEFTTNVGHLYKAGECYFIDPDMPHKLRPGTYRLHPYETLPAYNGSQQLMIVRTGGLGDMFALSIFQDLKPLIITTPQMLPAFAWWKVRPRTRLQTQPLFTLRKGQKIQDAANRYGVLNGEDAIEIGSRQNWFEVFNLAAARTQVTDDMLRPQLRPAPMPMNDTCIVVAKSTSINRSADEATLIRAAQQFFTNVETIPPTTAFDYLNRLAAAAFVISVDTSAIHFREGIGRPALGVYGAFTAHSRTAYYQYTHSIDVQSSCTEQPCHRRNQLRCPHAPAMATAAPCLSAQFTPNLFEQITNALEKYLTQHADPDKKQPNF